MARARERVKSPTDRSPVPTDPAAAPRRPRRRPGMPGWDRASGTSSCTDHPHRAHPTTKARKRRSHAGHRVDEGGGHRKKIGRIDDERGRGVPRSSKMKQSLGCRASAKARDPHDQGVGGHDDAPRMAAAPSGTAESDRERNVGRHAHDAGAEVNGRARVVGILPTRRLGGFPTAHATRPF